MPKKLAKKIIKQTFEMPGQVTREAMEQAGVVPRKEGERPELAEEELKKKAEEEKAKSLKRAAQIEEKIKELVEKRKAAKAQAKEAEKLEEKEKPKKPFHEPSAKKPRGLWAGLKARFQKSRPELAGRRVSG